MERRSNFAVRYIIKIVRKRREREYTGCVTRRRCQIYRLFRRYMKTCTYYFDAVRNPVNRSMTIRYARPLM